MGSLDVAAVARYASLYFVACIDMNFNELITLEIIHMFVETLDRYFGNVCELDIMCASLTTRARLSAAHPSRHSCQRVVHRGVRSLAVVLHTADSTSIKHTIC